MSEHTSDPEHDSPIPSCFREDPPELLILDVDGVLTSNHILLDGQGQEWKPFFIPDGVGIKMLRLIGVPTALISGRKSEVTHRRAQELSIDWHKSGVSNKAEATQELLEESKVAPHKAVFVGDDLIDLPAMEIVGLPVAVANARPQVKRAARAITQQRGGEGAVREVCEWILHARGDWDRALGAYLP